MDFYTNSTFRIQKGRGLGSRDPTLKFWDPYNFRTNRAIRFKFSTELEVDPPCVRTIKPPLSWRSRGHVTNFKILELSLAYFQTNQAICFKFGT